MLKEDDVVELSRKIDSKKVMAMIESLMETVKEYKNVTAINPLFEVTLLKLAALENKGEKVTPIREIKQQTIEEVAFEKPVKPQLKEEKLVENTEQISLFEEPKPEPVKPIILSDDVLILNYTEKETSFEIDDDLMIDIMVSSKKEAKNRLLNDWKNIKQLLAHPKLGKAASLLIDAHPLVANNKILILEVPLPKAVETINSKKIQKDLQDVILNTFGSKMFIYAVSRSDSVRLQKRYMDLAQLNKLPKQADITLEFKGE